MTLLLSLINNQTSLPSFMLCCRHLFICKCICHLLFEFHYLPRLQHKYVLLLNHLLYIPALTAPTIHLVRLTICCCRPNSNSQNKTRIFCTMKLHVVFSCFVVASNAVAWVVPAPLPIKDNHPRIICSHFIRNLPSLILDAGLLQHGEHSIRTPQYIQAMGNL